jgi:hypothetical protein
MPNVKSKSAVILTCAISGLIFFAAILRIEAAPRGAGAAAQAEASRIAVNSDDIGGVVTSANGPEAGVWVIAETTDLPTKFRKIVITDDAGRYLIPEMPKANYKVWVRGYGLVDSDPVTSTPGKTLALKAVVAPTPQAAAQYYPASYWVSLLNVPPKSAFPMTIPAPPALEGGDTGEGDQVKQTHISSTAHPPTTLQTQAEWLYDIKACYGCHQLGTKSTREIPASLGKFETSKDAWARFISSSQLGRGMMHGLNLLGHDQALEMFADWGDRIAKGEVPPVPPRPQGTERNVVVSVWDWSVRASFLHALISTDKRNPTVNANGPVYGADWSAGALAVIDPVTNSRRMIEVPFPDNYDRTKLAPWSPQSQLAPSVYFGDELVWKDPINPGPITMDGQGRVWFNVENQIGNPAFCKVGSNNPYAKYSPREFGGKGVDVYDPKTGKWGFVNLCFRSTRIMFGDDKDNTLYFSVQGDPGGIGWVNTRVWDETHDSEKSQGWCPAVIDYNGDGKLGPFTKPPAPLDPKLDRAIAAPGAYGVAYNTADGSVWYSAVTAMPGKLIRMVRGSNPPETCNAEVYEVPYDAKGFSTGGSHPRGMAVDSKGIVWASLASEGVLARFDRSKCKVLTGPEATTGRHCPEGWEFYPIPGPTFKTQPEVKADFNYYMWVDQHNALGMGADLPIVDGADSDSLLIFHPDTKQWVRIRVPYPMGFFSRFFDARIDNPNTGWKGRGLWAANQQRGSQLTEGGKDMPSQLAHFQVRPDPLAH